MNAESAQREFEQFISDRGHTVRELSVEEGITLTLAFYRDRRASDCPPNSGGDMLLFQWGDYANEGEQFTLDITRQFIINGDSEDENIWQLSLTFTFAATERLREVPSGNKWCPKPRPQAVAYFETFIRNSAAFAAVRDQQVTKVELNYGCVG